MRSLTLGLLIATCCIFSACKSQNNSGVDISTWITCELDGIWTFNAPKGTRVIYERGIDSTPGYIILATNDSLNLEFDSGFESAAMDTVCNLGSETVYAKQRVARGDYKYLNKPDTLHQARVDTVNGLAAIMIIPEKVGAGTTEISISNCNSNRWLAVYGKNIPADKQELVLKMYQSIRQTKLK